MKKRTLIIIFLITLVIIAAIFTLTSCTENTRAKAFGGTMSISIPADEEFINATWKDADLWIITRSKTTPNRFYMHESSEFGVWQGTVIITQ